jgi:hypothetical protein
MSDFLNDLQRATIQKLTADGARFDAGGDLRALLQAYYTVKERRIEPRVRSVHRAPEFDAAVTQLNIAEQTSGAFSESLAILSLQMATRLPHGSKEK